MYVPVTPTKSYEQYKFIKNLHKDVFMTPMHLACRLSNDEAIRVLIEKHQFDMNILLDEKSPVFELISTSTYQDLVILSYAMKTCNPDVNAGNKLPINQAIERGNKLITKILLEHGKPNFYKKDLEGFAPIHVASIKRDYEMFQMLYRRGADPFIPDKEGNTCLHYLCEGAVKETELQFIKDLVEIYGLRMTRNNEHMTPFDLIRAYPKKEMPFRNAPNLRREAWDYLEDKINADPDIIDPENYADIHLAIIRGEIGEVDRLIEKDEANLNMRDMEGKTPYMLSIEHERVEIADLIFKKGAKVRQRESKMGNTALHIAAKMGNFHAAKDIIIADPDLALFKNFESQSPFHTAVESRSLEVLQELEEYKIASLTIKNTDGDNPLFTASKVGDKDIFEWFGGKIDFFKARGDRNYKGQTIEHYVCMLSKHDILQYIKPLPDTKDYYGNLPIFYSIQNNDALMINKYFKKGKQYFHIKNFRNQNLFHIAGRYNSFEALISIVKNNIFFEELLKRDFKGDTPLHSASKNGSAEVLEFYLSNCTEKFTGIENDFGLTPLEAVHEKLKFIEGKDNEIDDEEFKSQVYDLKR
jgi:ankyrin repeat protein